jgi:ribosomal RNA assembly protein
VYTNSTFSGGRGISIFTTPRIAEEFVALLPFRDSTVLDGINNPDGPWYTQKLPAKGIGMLAKRNLKRGDLIAAYTPVLLAHMEDALSARDREKFLRFAVDQLPVATKESYFSLATIFGDPTVIVQDVVKANAFEMQVGGQMHLAVIPEPSRMNHECAPKYVHLFLLSATADISAHNTISSLLS